MRQRVAGSAIVRFNNVPMWVKGGFERFKYPVQPRNGLKPVRTD